ncbi:myelin-oligodendrocyte glycoprotein isoform X1 [Vulpes lagopus]|uniref:myelin-oligodendrocyte glycoprotein isoform X1 n=1 Tax=Vulpes lagopus TaxID=494514 RepID=UPI001BC9E477|nr:myelin-oligodendrocyte glycoprotein isoform X1 [Vulpes lagopus]
MASPWSSSLPSCLPLLLFLLQLSWSTAGQFRVIGPGHPLRALVGDEAELPCRIYPGKNATGMEVGWYRPPFSRVVHLYRNGRDQDAEQAPEYRGRTELLKESMGEGKVTLRISNVRFSDEGGFTCFFRDHSYQEEAAMELQVEDPFYWINPGVLVVIAVLPVLLLQIAVGLVYFCLQHRLRGKLRAEIENLHRTFDRSPSCSFTARCPVRKDDACNTRAPRPCCMDAAGILGCHKAGQRSLLGAAFLDGQCSILTLGHLISVQTSTQSLQPTKGGTRALFCRILKAKVLCLSAL